MKTARWLPLAVVALMCGCSTVSDTTPAQSPIPGAPSSPAPSNTVPSSTVPPSTPPSRAEALKEWETVAREHFKESALALQEVAEASAAEDEAGLRAGCQRLHDTNVIGLQQHLPTPESELTAELQRMIDDMNVATRACLRFALGRDLADAANYREYLARAVEHLYRAKAIMTAI